MNINEGQFDLIVNVFRLTQQAYEHLHHFVTNADRKTELAKKRLAETQEELSGEVNEKVSRSSDAFEIELSLINHNF
jgi:hypothetical protein